MEEYPEGEKRRLSLMWDLVCAGTSYRDRTAAPAVLGGLVLAIIGGLEGEMFKEVTSKHGVPMKGSSLLEFKACHICSLLLPQTPRMLVVTHCPGSIE